VGAGEGFDGTHALHFPWSSRNIPVEIIESRSPLVITRKALRVDSGGPGRFRGGCGQELVVTISPAQDERVAFALHADNLRFPPSGLAGGKTGASGVLVHNGRVLDANSEEVLSSFVFLEPGDELSVLLAGGGGYGDPLERDIERVLADVNDAVVSVEAASREYGVVIDSETLRVDEPATLNRRMELRVARQGSSPW
jgi:N-methylhydantoinase B